MRKNGTYCSKENVGDLYDFDLVSEWDTCEIEYLDCDVWKSATKNFRMSINILQLSSVGSVCAIDNCHHGSFCQPWRGIEV